jgi:hypothetical protein
MEHTLCLPETKEVKYHDMPKANYYWANKVNTFKRNYIKSYDIPDNTFNEIKQMYQSSNVHNHNCNITDKVNTWVLQSYLTNNIKVINLFTNPKDLTTKVNNYGSKVIRHKCRRLFLIPEMNQQYTKQQILKAL